MNNQKFLSLLGMCRRAGKLACGHDSTIEAVRSRRAKLCLLSCDSSERLRKEIGRECSFENIDVPIRLLPFTMMEIGSATALKSAVLSVNDEGFAKTLLSHMDDQKEVHE